MNYKTMSNIQFFAVKPDGPTPLPVPEGVETIHDLLDDLELGVYTSLCTFEHNKFLFLEAHLDRLQDSVHRMGWDYPLDRQLIRRVLHELCTAYPQENSRVRLDVLAAPPPGSGGSRLTAALSPFPPYPPEIYTEGVEVGLVDRLRREEPLIKDARFVLERRPYQSSQYHEQLLVDGSGRILEGMTSNFYGVRGGVLYTAGEGVLEGVARRIVLREAERLGVPVRLEAVRVDEIGRLDEAAISSASRALVPVVKIGGRMVGNGRPGLVTTRILAAYRDFLAREIRTAV